MRLVAMLVISGAVLCASLQIRAVARPVPLQSSRSFAPSMLAKSKKKKRKKPAASTSRPKPAPIDLDAPTFATTAPAAEPTATQPQTSSSDADPAGPAPNVDSVLRAAGLSPDAMPEPESTAAKSGGVLNRLIFGDDSKLNLDDPLSRIPKAGQVGLEIAPGSRRDRPGSRRDRVEPVSAGGARAAVRGRCNSVRRRLPRRRSGPAPREVTGPLHTHYASHLVFSSRGA